MTLTTLLRAVDKIALGLLTTMALGGLPLVAVGLFAGSFNA